MLLAQQLVRKKEEKKPSVKKEATIDHVEQLSLLERGMYESNSRYSRIESGRWAGDRRYSKYIIQDRALPISVMV